MRQMRDVTNKIKPIGDDLRAYRRLVELQKQMIQMAHQHEHAKRACHGLREQMALDVLARHQARRSPLQRLQLSAAGLLKRAVGFAVTAVSCNRFRSTPSSSC